MNGETKIANNRDLKLVAALDVGSSKVSCIIARIDDKGRLEVIGVGHRRSYGVEKGAVVDMEKAEASIRAAVDQAVKTAGVNIDNVVVNLSASSIQSQIKEVDVLIDGQSVDRADVQKALKEVARQVDPGDKLIVHAFPACFSLDDNIGITDPVGMYADRLSVALNMVTAGAGPIRNLESAVGRAHLGVSRMVASSYAAGLATLVADEMDLGAAVVDMGGGSTNVAVFAKGAMVYCASIPMGGDDLTRTIAGELLTPLEEAERIKTLYGSVASGRPDVQDVINIRTLGENETAQSSHQQVTRVQISQALEPKLNELFDQVRDKLVESGFEYVAGKRVVLTGGASQLTGMMELAQRRLGKQVRLGRQSNLKGLADAANAPAFATCVGLLKYVLSAPIELGEENYAKKATSGKAEGGIFSRIMNWLRDHF